MRTPALIFAGCILASACTEDLDIEDGAQDGFPSGKADGGLQDGSAEARGVLALVNDAAVDLDELDLAVGLSSRAAANIIGHRDGLDRLAGTGDDDRFDQLAELDAIPYVGPATLAALLDYARDTGRVRPAPRIDAVFSPQPASASHTRRIARLIDDAERSVDLAMYSLSDAEISTALAAAASRGVAIRMLFETAGEDRKLDAAGRASSKSGRLERDGVDVRWVNKILHHKLAIIDGPRDDAGRADTATIVTGSANWSYGGAQVYDENTVFITGSAELSASYQREFDHLWGHAADFALGAATAPVVSTADLDDAGLPDDVDAAALFTSANFTVKDGSTTFRIERARTTVSDQLVAAIGRAERSIHIASGHLRLRAVADALVAARAANPALDIKVYLDQQEYISASGHAAQLREVEACLAAATTPTRRWTCTTRDFLFGKQVGDAGIAVRYKSYAYRWDYSYAAQMHHKYVIVDGDELFTGSYNLSMNAEQATFENLVHLRGASYAAVIAAFEANFAQLWEVGRDRLDALRGRIAVDPTIPLVFDAMALTWQEVGDLRALIRSHCAAVDSTEYRDDPAGHRSCPR